MLVATTKKSAREKKVSDTTKAQAESKMEEGNVKKTAAQKRKDKVPNTDKDNDSDEPDPKKAKCEITAYVFVTSPTSGAIVRWWPGAGQKSAPLTVTIRWGPFFFNLDNTFMHFKSKLTASLPCKESLIQLGQLQWHYEKPATDKCKPLIDEAGFKAMQTVG